MRTTFMSSNGSIMDPRQTRRQTLRGIAGATAAGGLLLLGSGSGAAQPGRGSKAGVRAVHASPDAPAVDVFVDGGKVLGNVEFGDVSGYLELEAGEYNIKVAPAGAGTGAAVIDADVEFDNNTDYTVAAVNKLNEIKPEIFVDDNDPAPNDAARVRAVHLSPDAPAVDITVDGNVVIESLEYRTASGYLEVPGGDYTIGVRPAGGDEAVFTDDVTLENATTYSALAAGLLTPDKDQEPFTLIPTVDAESPSKGKGRGGD